MKSVLHKCYDDFGNLKDNALNIAFNLGKKEGLRKGKKQGRADALGEYATMLMNVFSHSCEFYFISDDWTIEAIEKDKIDDVILKCLEQLNSEDGGKE